MVVCPCVLALRQTGDLSRVYPASRPMTAGIGSSIRCDREKDKWKPMDEWLDSTEFGENNDSKCLCESAGRTFVCDVLSVLHFVDAP